MLYFSSTKFWPSELPTPVMLTTFCWLSRVSWPSLDAQLDERSYLIPSLLSFSSKVSSVYQRNLWMGVTEICIGQTSAWKVNVCTPQTATAVCFVVVIPAGQPFTTGLSWSHPIRYIFINIYLDSNDYCQDNRSQLYWSWFSTSYDQEDAVVLMPLIAVFKAEIDDSHVEVGSCKCLNDWLSETAFYRCTNFFLSVVESFSRLIVI